LDSHDWLTARAVVTIGSWLIDGPLLLVPLFTWFGTWWTPLEIVAGLRVLWCAAC
jgi:hypothetical protein